LCDDRRPKRIYYVDAIEKVALDSLKRELANPVPIETYITMPNAGASRASAIGRRPAA